MLKYSVNKKTKVSMYVFNFHVELTVWLNFSKLILMKWMSIDQYLCVIWVIEKEILYFRVNGFVLWDDVLPQTVGIYRKELIICYGNNDYVEYVHIFLLYKHFSWYFHLAKLRDYFWQFLKKYFDENCWIRYWPFFATNSKLAHSGKNWKSSWAKFKEF